MERHQENFDTEPTVDKTEIAPDVAKKALFSLRITEERSGDSYSYETSLRQSGDREQLLTGLAGSELGQELTRESFESGVKDGFNTAINYVNQALAQAGLDFRIEVTMEEVYLEEDIESEAKQMVAEAEDYLIRENLKENPDEDKSSDSEQK